MNFLDPQDAKRADDLITALCRASDDAILEKLVDEVSAWENDAARFYIAQSFDENVMPEKEVDEKNIEDLRKALEAVPALRRDGSDIQKYLDEKRFNLTLYMKLLDFMQEELGPHVGDYVHMTLEERKQLYGDADLLPEQTLHILLNASLRFNRQGEEFDRLCEDTDLSTHLYEMTLSGRMKEKLEIFSTMLETTQLFIAKNLEEYFMEHVFINKWSEWEKERRAKQIRQLRDLADRLEKQPDDVDVMLGAAEAEDITFVQNIFPAVHFVLRVKGKRASPFTQILFEEEAKLPATSRMLPESQLRAFCNAVEKLPDWAQQRRREATAAEHARIKALEDKARHLTPKFQLKPKRST